MKINKHYFGAYMNSGDWSIIHWAGFKTDVAKLQRRSEVGVFSFYPVPVPGFEINQKAMSWLKRSNSAFVADMYKDCEGAYFVALKQSGKLDVFQLLPENLAKFQDVWIRIIFVFEEKTRIRTSAEDVFLFVGDFID